MTLRTLLVLCVAVVWAGLSRAELPLGKKPAFVSLSDDQGGRLNGKPWSSAELIGKVHALFYADPDEKDLNEGAAEALKNAKFPKELYGSIAVVNMAATWLPNVAIESSLKSKQEKYPETLYLKDLTKVLVKEWKLGDDNNDIVVFDKSGVVVFSKDGKLSDGDIKNLLESIRRAIGG